MNSRRPAIIVTSYRGQPAVDVLVREAAAGERPRTDYVELARELNAEIIDRTYLEERATALSSAIARLLGDGKGQVVEALARSNRFGPLVVWNETVALFLASLFKLGRSRRDLISMSVAMSSPRRAVLLKHLRVHSHLSAIITYGTAQYEIAAGRLAVPREKLHLLLPKADERFWQPQPTPLEDAFCSVGWEARDYTTLARAVRDASIEGRIVVGSSVQVSSGRTSSRVLADVPSNVRLHTDLSPRRLRDLYASSRFVVVPLRDVDYDAGGTAVTEAMAMGKAVIVTRTRGQIDLVRDGEQGIYVPADDPPALREAIEHLVEHPETAERMGRAGRKAVEERHTLDAYIRRLAAIVREVQAGGGH